jgi:hypothetical protein
VFNRTNTRTSQVVDPSEWINNTLFATNLPNPEVVVAFGLFDAKSQFLDAVVLTFSHGISEDEMNSRADALLWQITNLENTRAYFVTTLVISKDMSEANTLSFVLSKVASKNYLRTVAAISSDGLAWSDRTTRTEGLVDRLTLSDWQLGAIQNAEAVEVLS